jgi:hypothetical protein
MHVECLLNDIALNYFKTEDIFEEMLSISYVMEWLNEKNVKLYLYYNENNEDSKDSKNNLVSFAMFTNLKRDPLKIHSKPTYLNYIYTFPKYRRLGFATNFLLRLKQLEEITIFSTDDITTNLCIKTGFNFSNKDNLYNQFPIYRYP